MGRWLAAAVVLAQATSLLPVGAFRIQPGESRVEFVMRDNRGGFSGVTERVEGAVIVRGDGEAFVASIEGRIDARTLTTGNGMRDAQMRRDFLHTEQFPFVTFKGTAANTERALATVIKVSMKGQLTIRDTTRDIEMPLDVTALADEYRASGEVVIRLSEFGIPIPRFLIFTAEDPVTVRLRVRLRRGG
jgi:polyisoprenoid-binding protein YceI